MDKETIIIPIASGKGGVGKSIISANIGIALAQFGHSTIVVDLDLGASNLHHYLNIPNEYPGIGEFLKREEIFFPDLQVPTSVPNLTLISGDGLSPHMANITYAEKMKLIKGIKKLEANFVILDLSAGSSFNTMDFFSIVSNGIILLKPEMPVIMNLLIFIKNLVLRIIGKTIRGNSLIFDYIHEIFHRSIKESPLVIEDIIEGIILKCPEVGERVKSAIQNIRPRLIMNMSTDLDELIWLKKVEKNIIKNLSIEVDNFGFIPFNPVIIKSINKRIPLLIDQPESPAAQGIQRIAKRIVRRWNDPIDNSWERLYHDTQSFFNEVMV
ncbi:MAG: P-loop NTPase [bacterium]